VELNEGTLVNSGTIAGPTGVILTGDNAAIFDTGTIASTDGGDAVLFHAPDPNSLTLSTGAVLIGTIDGGGTDGQIVLEGTGTLPNTITNFTAGSGLNVNAGASWTGTGHWTIATVTNSGAFQGGTLNTPLYLTGNFVQTSTGTLLVAVTPTVTSQFIVTGTAALDGGLEYTFAPGTYHAGSYNFLSATGGTTGNFSSVTYNGAVPAALTHGTSADSSGANLNLSGGGVVGPADDSVFSNINQQAATTTQDVNTSLLDKATEGSAAGNEAACAAAAAANATPGSSTAAQMASAIGNAFCGAGGWIEATGTDSNIDASNGAPSYNATTAGFLAGIDTEVNNSGTRLGVAVGYDQSWLKDSQDGSGNLNTVRAGLYGSQVLGVFTLAGDLMYGHTNTNSTRQTGIGAVGGSTDANLLSGGVQAGMTQQVLGYNITPAFGLRVAGVESGGFVESGSGILAPFKVTGSSSAYESIQPFVSVNISRSFLTASGVTVTPDITAGYFYEAADWGKFVALKAADGTGFKSAYNSLDPNIARLSLGLSAGENNWSLYAKYAAYLTGNFTAQTGEAGLQIKF
jgi:uncharacterized protein with beta-barrel porin domain